MNIRVDASGHFFQYDDDRPFFYLADTAWMLFSKLTEDDARALFADRAKKGFTVVQAVVFRDFFEPNTPNAYGVRPFASEEDMRAVRMNPDWIRYVDRVIGIAAEYGLIIGLLPTWGDKWNEHSNSAGPVIMDRGSAQAYCRFLSDSLAHRDNIIWILGGDSPVQTQDYADTIGAMARGVRSGGSRERLVTFHPTGMGSSEIFHSQEWLDFNAVQTSHYKPNIPGYLSVERLYYLQPRKPCLDMEPNYEYSPMFVSRRGQQPKPPVFSDYDVRKSLYRTVLAGAAGFTYGCEPIRQLYASGDRIHIWESEGLPTWKEAMNAPGSSQLSLLPEALAERSYFTRVPAQELLKPVYEAEAWPDRMVAGNQDPAAHVSVARCSVGSYIMAYMPVRQLLRLDTSGLTGDRLLVSTWNPETRELVEQYEMANEGSIIHVPHRDMDSFVVIDA